MINKDYDKVIKTYDSCITLNHLVTTMKFAALFEYKWMHDRDFYEFMMRIYEKHNQTVDRIRKIEWYAEGLQYQLN